MGPPAAEPPSARGGHRPRGHREHGQPRRALARAVPADARVVGAGTGEELSQVFARFVWLSSECCPSRPVRAGRNEPMMVRATKPPPTRPTLSVTPFRLPGDTPANSVNVS